MGWADCGTDSRGRPIGYAFEATCDEPGCEEKIDRGLSYACGGMHGEDSSCEEYFCPAHLYGHDHEHPRGMVCSRCLADLDSEAGEEETPDATAHQS